MTEQFDATTWRARVADWWREVAPDLPGAMGRLGVRTAYDLLTANAWLPLLAALEDAEWMAWEYELLGLSPGDQVMSLHRETLQAQGVLTSRELAEHYDGERVQVARLGCCSPASTDSQGNALHYP